MLNILALLSRSKLHCFSHPSQCFGATCCNASPHNSWRNRPPHSAIEGLPADNGNYSVWLRCCHCPSDLLCLLKLQSALNSTFYASVTCTHAKTEQLSTRLIISYRMLNMEFSVSLLKYMFDVKRKLLSFSKNGMFQHLWSQAVRSVWEFENGLRHFTAWRKWEIPFISIFKNQIKVHFLAP